MKIWILKSNNEIHSNLITVMSNKNKSFQKKYAESYKSGTVFTDINNKTLVCARAWKNKGGYSYSLKSWNDCFNKG